MGIGIMARLCTILSNMSDTTQRALTYPKFTPGTGKAPPYLAGRQAAQQSLQDMLADLRQGEGANRDVIIIGPRGNGKTALINWFKDVCSQDDKLDVVYLTPSEVPNLDVLATELAPPDRFRDWLPTTLALSLGPTRLHWELEERPDLLTRLLETRCRKRPLALLLDEAHTLKPDLGHILLNASQRVRAAVPFLLVLAGTPGLQYQLNQMSATFWSRSKKLGIGRLNADSTRAALVEPFRQHGISVSEPALDAIIRESQGYPYFIQCWGEALVAVLQAHERDTRQRSRRIDPDQVALARPAVEEEQVGHYEIFREQIAEAGLQPLAAAVSRAYNDTDTLEEHILDDAIGQALQRAEADGQPPLRGDIISKRQILASFGYVWRPPAAAAIWHSGVPSLMQHVLQIEQKDEAHPR